MIKRRKKNRYVIEGDVAKIYFTNCDDYFLCDADMVEALLHFTWFKDRKGYAHTNNDDRRKMMAHTFIMGRKEGLEVDHINRNRCDNRRCNLRQVTHLENIRNKDMTLYKKSNPATGVYLDKRKSVKRVRYTASIMVNKKTIHLGTFDTFDEALKARKSAEIFYWGEQANEA